MASIHAIRVELALTSCREVEEELGDDLADSFAMVFFCLCLMWPDDTGGCHKKCTPPFFSSYVALEVYPLCG